MSRPVLKTLSYAAMHFGVAFAVAFSLTRSWSAAAAIGLVEPLVQTGAYVLHERLWERRPGRLRRAVRSCHTPAAA